MKYSLLGLLFICACSQFQSSGQFDYHKVSPDERAKFDFYYLNDGYIRCTKSDSTDFVSLNIDVFRPMQDSLVFLLHISDSTCSMIHKDLFYREGAFGLLYNTDGSIRKIEHSVTPVTEPAKLLYPGHDQAFIEKLRKKQGKISPWLQEVIK